MNPTTHKEPPLIRKALSSKLNENNTSDSLEVKSKTQLNQEQPILQKHTPMVIGPNDELIPIGISGIFENDKEKNEKRDETVYRLYEDGIPPYLYFTNKLDTNGFVSYEDMNAAHYNSSIYILIELVGLS